MDAIEAISKCRFSSREIMCLIKLYRQGQFPFDKLITFFDFADINEAIAAMKSGQVIKPVLRFSGK
jgi:aryl-alcohol dehydrogenase